MNNTWRFEIEVRLFVFSVLGEMNQSGKLAEMMADQPQLLADLLRLYPLERWHEQGFITRDQLTGWIAQAIALLMPSEGNGTA